MVIEAHKKSSNHRKEIEESSQCGCFHCLAVFEPKYIEEWVDEDKEGTGTTAMCPRCGIDTVIGDKSGYPITKEFLKEMQKLLVLMKNTNFHIKSVQTTSASRRV